MIFVSFLCIIFFHSLQIFDYFFVIIFSLFLCCFIKIFTCYFCILSFLFDVQHQFLPHFRKLKKKMFFNSFFSVTKYFVFSTGFYNEQSLNTHRLVLLSGSLCFVVFSYFNAQGKIIHLNSNAVRNARELN